MYTWNLLWNHNLILCVHITSSLESYPDFIWIHNIISGIITWFYAYIKGHLWNLQLVSNKRSKAKRLCFMTESYIKAWEERARKAIERERKSQEITILPAAPNPRSATKSLYYKYDQVFFRKSTKKTDHKVRKILRPLWFAERCFGMRVYSYSCDVIFFWKNVLFLKLSKFTENFYFKNIFLII